MLAEGELLPRVPVAVVVAFEEREALGLELRLVVGQRSSAASSCGSGRSWATVTWGWYGKCSSRCDRAGAHIGLHVGAPLRPSDQRHEDDRRHRPEGVGAGSRTLKGS